MPLSFPSLSHGTVVFGFYNIDTDGLLLDRCFFFCTDFCQVVRSLSAAPATDPAVTPLVGHVFPDPAAIGDLMGAIHGVHYTGYLGAVYRRWPFPADPEAFRQHLDGADNRGETLELLAQWADPVTLAVTREPAFRRVELGEYQFSREGFAALVEYVTRGGYPTWQGYEAGQMPDVARPLVPILDQLRS